MRCDLRAHRALGQQSAIGREACQTSIIAVLAGRPGLIDILLSWPEYDQVRTVLTLDDDVADLLQSEVRRSGVPLKHVVNRLLRTSLRPAGKAGIPKPFKVRGAIHAGVPEEWTSGCVQDLLDLLDRPETSHEGP